MDKKRIIMVLAFILCFISAFSLGRITSKRSTEYIIQDQVQAYYDKLTMQYMEKLEALNYTVYYRPLPENIGIAAWLEEVDYFKYYIEQGSLIYVSYTEGLIKHPIFWSPYFNEGTGQGIILIFYP